MTGENRRLQKLNFQLQEELMVAKNEKKSTQVTWASAPIGEVGIAIRLPPSNTMEAELDGVSITQLFCMIRLTTKFDMVRIRV